MGNGNVWQRRSSFSGASNSKGNFITWRFAMVNPYESRGGRPLDEPDHDAKKMFDEPNGR